MGSPQKKLRSVANTISEVPFIDLKRQLENAGKTQRILDQWASVLAETAFVGGKRVGDFEAKLAGKLSVRSTLACANGTDALVLALQACGVKHGSKVALPNLTFWATYEAVVQLGGVPVLIDSDPNDLQMSFEEFQEAHERHGFEAAILVHLFGWASPQLFRFREFCEQEGIALIEDGAQSYGVQVGGESVYHGAQIATISFYPAKVFGGAMDGGAIVGSDPKLIETCRTLANHGRSGHYSFSHVGWNSRMSGLQAAFLSETMDIADEAIASRRRALEVYHAAFEREVKEGSLKFWRPQAGCEGNGYLAVMSVKGASGEGIQKKLQALRVGTGRVYPETVIEQACVPRDVLRVSELEFSRSFAKTVFNLPLFGGIHEEECLFAASALRKLMGRN